MHANCLDWLQERSLCIEQGYSYEEGKDFIVLICRIERRPGLDDLDICTSTRACIDVCCAGIL